MQKERETNGLDGMGAKLPDAGMFLEAQRVAAENASRMANAACQYAMSLNRTWLDLWDSRLSEYMELPKRWAEAQADFVEQALDHYQESMQRFGGIAMQAKDEAESAIKETEAAGERTAREFQAEAKDMARGSRPKENPMKNAGEREPEHQLGAH